MGSQIIRYIAFATGFDFGDKHSLNWKRESKWVLKDEKDMPIEYN